MKKIYFFILIIILGFSNSDVSIRMRTLNWEFDKSIDFGDKYRNVLFFEGCEFNVEKQYLPVYSEIIPLKNKAISFKLEEKSFIELTDSIKDVDLENIPEELEVSKAIFKSRNEYFLKIEIFPFIKKNGKVFLLSSFGFKTVNNGEIPILKSSNLWKSESVLKNGDWIKIRTTKKGIHRITYSKLQEWGFSNPQDVCIYGNNGYMLPEKNTMPDNDGLQKISQWYGKDASGNDCVFFFSSGNTKWEFDETQGSFTHLTNVYSQSLFYYLTEDGGSPAEVSEFSPINEDYNVSVNSFDDYSLHEIEKYNLIKSGKQWFGERFIKNSLHNIEISSTDILSDELSTLEINAAARASESTSLKVVVNGNNIGNIDFNSVNLSDATSTYADDTIFKYEINEDVKTLTIGLNYLAGSTNAEAWLDFIRLNYRRRLNFIGSELYFRDSKSVENGNIAQFVISNADAGSKVFDITDIFNISEVPFSVNGNQIEFKRPADNLREYVVFTPETNFTEPEKVGEVLNQNLHALQTPEMVVISHPDFLAVANELAQFHRNNDGMTVEVVKTSEVFNEFSYGMPDATGIRNFIKMLYDRDGQTLKYVLLLGDGSYDNRNISGINKNYVPTYQSANSLSPTSSFITDDYFALLDEDETVYKGAVDLGIGRIPSSSVYEAQVVLEKIKDYNSPEALGAWRNIVCFIGDDEDGNLHMRDSETLANKINSEHSAFLTSKIYFDAYPQEVTPGGERYPDVSEAINNRVKEGVLILNYVGHANDRFMADEHVLDISQINSWSNQNNLPIFVTATCGFSRFDADETSAGENVLFNPSGGGIGLFSTTRVVFAYSNFLLSKSFYNHVFEQDSEGSHYRMGDIIRLAKIGTTSHTNKRNFSLLADPALRLSYPKYKVVTTKINNKNAEEEADTIMALNMITIEGHIADYSGNKLTGFNGEIAPVVYDKAFMASTLGNGDEQPMEFKVQDNVIYKGLASVTNGDFSFSFIVPKDISYNLGQGKIVYYASNGSDDAHGAFENFLIGGSADGQFPDNTGPEVELFLDDENFLSGGEVSKNPLLIAHISDENGINTVGAGIGHDITAVIDDDIANIFVLNEYYEANIDDHTSGVIEYPFKNLSEGKHTLKLKVWDVANNSTEVEVDFVVTSDFFIDEIGNYPNPVVEYTYFKFSHNQPDATFQGLVEIFDRNGRVVDSFSSTITSNNLESNPVRWDVADAEIPIRAGIYLYRISIKSEDGAIARKSGKMSIMR